MSFPCKSSQSSKWASLVAHTVKNLPAMWEIQVWPLGQEDPLEKGMATHSSIIAWRIPRTEEPGRLQSIGSQSQTWLNDYTFTFFFSEHWIEFPELYSRFSFVIYFIRSINGVYMSIPISHSSHTPLSPLVSICLISASMSLFLLCKQDHLYHVSGFHIQAIICNICFYLSKLIILVALSTLISV